MELVFVFRRLVFSQVLLGIVAFCMAERNPGLLLVAGALAALSWYVVEGPTGSPLPRVVINLFSIAAVAWLLVDLYWQRGDVILAMGHFTMWLQVVLLYAEKSNRDYGQLLVLSLLQMVGAAVLSTSFIFGSILVGYCLLSLVTVLLLQLKSTSDAVADSNQAAAPRGVRAVRPKPVTTQGHRWHFRSLAIVLAAACASIAAVIYLLIPRSADVNRFANVPLQASTAGFSASVSLTGGAPSGGSSEAVVMARLLRDGENIGSADHSFLLRGASLDRYDPINHTWVRSYNVAETTLTMNQEGSLVLANLEDDVATVEAEITAKGTPQQILFTIHPISSISSGTIREVNFSPRDQQIAARDSSLGVLSYTVRAPVEIPESYFSLYRYYGASGPTVQLGGGDDNRLSVADPSNYARGWRSADHRTLNLALDLIQDAGLKREATVYSGPDDLAIAQHFANYLRETFSYSLANPELPPSQDPISVFLFDRREGHCELFAAGLAAMCRSVGIPARVVTGYRATEFNRLGGYYAIRPTDAHAWTEVYAGRRRGWVMLDATPPAAVAAEHAPPGGPLALARELYEYLEFFWLSKFISYNVHTREAVISDVEQSVQKTTANQGAWLDQKLTALRDFLDRWQINNFVIIVIGIIFVFILIGFASLIHTLAIRRRRLVALQLNRMPRKDRRRLARQLRFYLIMLDLLERHGHVRPVWQTPFGYAKVLVGENARRFGPVLDLTEHFYEIRFGKRELTPNRREVIKVQLRELEDNLLSRAI